MATHRRKVPVFSGNLECLDACSALCFVQRIGIPAKQPKSGPCVRRATIAPCRMGARTVLADCAVGVGNPRGNDETHRMADDTHLGAAAAGPAQVTIDSQPAVLDARPLTRLAAWIEARAMFIVCVAAVVVISLQGIPSHFSQDGWLALIAGRHDRGARHPPTRLLRAHGLRRAVGGPAVARPAGRCTSSNTWVACSC